MPRPRTPNERAAVTGAAIVHPDRFKKRSNPKTTRLGEPSEWLGGEQRVAWDMFQQELPWLMEADRGLVEVAASIRARLMMGEDIGVSQINQLRMCLGQMGATPADRSKVSVPDEREEDPADRFFQ